MDKQTFIERGKDLNDSLCFEGTELDFDEYCDCFETEDVINHKDWIEELFGDYLNLLYS